MFAESLQDFVCATAAKPQDAWVLLKRVPDPERYGVAQVRLGCITDLAEKPPNPKSDLAVTGIYLYPVDVFSMIRQIRASGRGEWEITDVNRGYMQEKRLSYCELKGFWIDAGTPQALSAASHFMLPTPPPKIGLKSTG
jgi:glucose-1-phosphate thymidylyltransferase